MSNEVTRLIKRKRLGLNMTQKAVLLLMGDYARDDGTNVTATKARMANDLETDARSIRRIVAILIDRGYIVHAGRLPHPSGYKDVYRIDLDRVARQPSHDRAELDETGHTVRAWGDTVSGHGGSQGPVAPDTESGLDQDVDGRTQDVGEDTASGGTQGPVAPDTESGHGGTQCPVYPNNPKIPSHAGTRAPGRAREAGVAMPPSRDQQLAMLAKWVTGPRSLPNNLLSKTDINQLLAAGMVSQDDLQRKGIDP